MHGLQAVADMATAVGKAVQRFPQGADKSSDLLIHQQLQAFLPRFQDHVNEFLAATSKLSDSAAALADDFAEVLSQDGVGETSPPAAAAAAAAAAAVELQSACKAAAAAHSAMASQLVISPFLREIQLPSQLEQQLALDASETLDAEVHKQLKVVNTQRQHAILELFKSLLRAQCDWACSSTAALALAIHSAEAACGSGNLSCQSHTAACQRSSCRDLLIDVDTGLMTASADLAPSGDVSEPPSTTASVAYEPELWDFNEEALEVPEDSEAPSTTASVAQGPDLWDFDEAAVGMPETSFLDAGQRSPTAADDLRQNDLLEFDGETQENQQTENSEEDAAIVREYVLEWQRGKNVRALLASLHDMLPAEVWQKKTLSELLDPLAVKEAYKAASVVTSQSSEHHLSSKTLTRELSKVLENAWNAFILELVSSGLEEDCDELKEAIGIRVQQWKQGKNIRTLLASLHEVTPPSHSAVRSTLDMPDTAALKIVYKAALLKVHPDKCVLPKALAEPVFHALQDAWDASKQGRAL